jgi:hypothetical protein
MQIVLDVHMRFDRMDAAIAKTAAQTTNISREGLFIRMDPPKPVGTKVRMSLRIGEDVIKLEGIVVRTVPDAVDPTRPTDGIAGVAVFVTRASDNWERFCETVEQHRTETDGVDVDLED